METGCAQRRVALITGNLGLGGATVFVLHLAAELQRRGDRVLVCCLEPDRDLLPSFERADISTIFAPPGIAEDRVGHVVRQLVAFNPHILAANLGHLSFEVLRYAPPGTFRLGMAHADNEPVYELLDLYAPWLDCIAAVSTRIQKELADRPRAGRCRSTSFFLGIPLPAHIPERPASPGPLKLLYLGRLAIEQKRIDRLPLLTDHLHTRGVAFELTLVGEGPESGWLKDQFRAKPYAQRIAFTGMLHPERIGPIMEKSDVLLLMSDYEGLPLSLLEAMSRGVVPVVPDLPSGFRDVLDTSTGFLIEPGNIAAYAAVLENLSDNRTLLSQTASGCASRVRATFSLEAMGDRWDALIQASFIDDPRWTNQTIHAPVGLAHKPLYHPALRPIRRLLKSLKGN